MVIVIIMKVMERWFDDQCNDR